MLRAHAGRIIVDAVNELFDAATTGPTIVTPDAQALLASGANCETLHADSVDLLAGRLDGPLAACRDPHSPPPDIAGEVCDAFANGRCYTCPNAIITRDHLPGVVRLAELLNPDRYGRPDAWKAIWQPTYQFLTETVLPEFDDADVTAARERAGDVFLDAALEQELGSA